MYNNRNDGLNNKQGAKRHHTCPDTAAIETHKSEDAAGLTGPAAAASTEQQLITAGARRTNLPTMGPT